MKLKTTAEEVSVLAGRLPHDRWLHDATCAHALMLALENRVQRAEDAYHLQEQVTLRGIKRFADELMREWGFDSGEDA